MKNRVQQPTAQAMLEEMRRFVEIHDDRTALLDTHYFRNTFKGFIEEVEGD